MRINLKRLVYRGISLVWSRFKPVFITLVFLYISAFAQMKMDKLPDPNRCFTTASVLAGIPMAGLTEIKPTVTIAGRTLALTAHARERMLERKISVRDIETAGRTGQLFAYMHNGLVKIGYYDARKMLFVAVDKRHHKILTTIRGVSERYVQRLL